MNLIQNNQLYNLSSKKKLSILLHCSTSFLHKFKSSRNSFKIYTIRKKHSDGKQRTVEEPREFLKGIHKKLYYILKQLDYPQYLHSGIKGKNYITNTKLHTNSNYCITIDLHHFYQTVRKTFVRQMFIEKFNIVDDIAWLLSDLVTIPQENGSENYIPTGSPISQQIAFLTYEKTFNEINKLSLKYNIIFSLYVDDMTFSSENKIPNFFIKKIKNLIKLVNLEINNKKIEYFGKNKTKIITGCAINNHKLKIKNFRRNEIIELLKENSFMNNSKVINKISAQQQIEKSFMNTTKTKLKKNSKVYYKKNKN